MRMITHQPSTDDGSIMGMRHEFSPKKTTFGNKKKNLVSASPIFLPLAKHDDQDKDDEAGVSLDEFHT